MIELATDEGCRPIGAADRWGPPTDGGRRRWGLLTDRAMDATPRTASIGATRGVG